MDETNAETEDDFSSLIQLFETASRSYTQEEMEQLTDPHAIMKMFVVRGYIDDWDSISLRRGKNGYMYRRAEDGKFQFLHWDSDLTFGNSGAAFYQGLPRQHLHQQAIQQAALLLLPHRTAGKIHAQQCENESMARSGTTSQSTCFHQSQQLPELVFALVSAPAQNIMRREARSPWKSPLKRASASPPRRM